MFSRAYKFAIASSFLAAVTVQAVAEPETPAVQTQPISSAEKILWMADHLKNLDKGAKLKYQFSKSGSLEEGFKDTVELQILKVNNDATRNIAIDFFTGERHLPIDPRENVTGNQVLAIYLDGDLHEMHRLAHGSRPYFQHSIKTAFAENAKIEDVTVAFSGKKVAAKKVTIVPFVADPRRSLFEKFANKVYEFTFSEELPGALYSIHTVVPDSSNPKGKPLIEESLTLAEAK